MAPEKPETPAEKAAQEARYRKWQERYARQEARFWANKDLGAVHAGRQAGDEISIDAQVVAEKRRSIE